MKVMSLNVQSWDIFDDRVEALLKCVEENDGDIIGFQEITFKWQNILYPHFKDKYEIVGDWRFTSRGPDGFDNEKNSIFVKKEKFNVIETKTFWLSSTPNEESICEECVFPRVYTYALIEEKTTLKRFLFVNTHLDYLNETGRNNEMVYLIKFLKTLPKDLPIIMSGDFNSDASEQAYKSLSSVIKDSKTLFTPVDETPTYFAYKDLVKTRTNLIDYIFVNDLVDVHDYKVHTEEYNSRWVSDHYPVVVNLSIK